MASDLDRGAYAGKETYLYYNSASNASPTWVEMERVRNVQVNRGAAATEVNFHGSSATRNHHAYEAFNGSFEYVKKLGTDTVFAALETARDDQTIIELLHLNGPETGGGTASVGWRAPVILTDFSETSNGGDSVVVTINFALADAYTAAGAQVDVSAYTGTP